MLHTIVIGLIAGWLAGKLMRGAGYGMLMDIVLGLVGAVIGGWIFAAIGIHAYSTGGMIAMATLGAVALVAGSRALAGEL